MVSYILNQLNADGDCCPECGDVGPCESCECDYPTFMCESFEVEIPAALEGGGYVYVLYSTADDEALYKSCSDPDSTYITLAAGTWTLTRGSADPLYLGGCNPVGEYARSGGPFVDISEKCKCCADCELPEGCECNCVGSDPCPPD